MLPSPSEVLVPTNARIGDHLRPGENPSICPIVCASSAILAIANSFTLVQAKQRSLQSQSATLEHVIGHLSLAVRAAGGLLQLSKKLKSKSSFFAKIAPYISTLSHTRLPNRRNLEITQQ